MTAGVDRQAQVLIRKAAEDETVLLLEGIPDGPFGFHVQQAIEKLFKALLCQRCVPFKFTHDHDLDHLALLLKSDGESLPDAALHLERIGTFAVAHRYDDVPEFHVLDRPSAIDTVRLIREHVLARIAALSGAADAPPVQ